MALLPCEGAEPITGYQLVERLGTGGYGEVWKVVAPGGLTKAIKIVYGHMQDMRAEQEMKALSRIRDVRHPFLLSLERFEIVDGQLVIVTELADMSLQDRYDACRKAGLRGIPREELLSYVRDAADALDYMSEQYGLQHLDIKPHNLLLVGGRIKVADFGLVKNLQGSSATATGGVTPIYASPEAFDGRVSRFSDQYSLAIVYQEMLTGIRPFPGTTPLQLAMQHTTSPPVLDPLPGPDRPAIARALAKVPEKRFATCREMVERLQNATAKLATPTPGLSIPVTPSPAALAPPAPAGDSDNLFGQATSVGLDKDSQAAVATLHVPTDSTSEAASAPVSPPESFAVSQRGAGSAPPEGRGLRPTLFVGVGGLAGAALRRLRRRLQDRFGGLSAVPLLRLLLIDTDRTFTRPVSNETTAETLDAQEVLLTPLRKPEQYRPQSRDLLRWLDRRWLYGIPRSLQTEGMRPLGRLAFIDHANELLTRLRTVLAEITQPEALDATVAATGLGLRDETPRVFLLASIAGGTGGGMIVDLAYSVRQVLRELNLPEDSVCAQLLFATSQKPTGKDLARVNACATLTELHHFSQPGVAYPGDPRYGLKACRAGEPPFTDGWLVHLGEDLDEAAADAATDNLAEFLYLQAVHGADAGFEHDLGAATSLAPTGGQGLCLRTFGMARITVPRYRLADHAGGLFCQYLIRRWRGERETAADHAAELGAFREQAAPGLEVDAVAGHFYAAAGTLWREDPKDYLRKFLDDAFHGHALRPGDPQLREVCGQAVRAAEALLGTGRSSTDKTNRTLTALEVALHDRVEDLSASLGRSVVEWFVGLIEDPRRRLIKAADAVARWFSQQLNATCEGLAADLVKLVKQREHVRAKLAAGDLPLPEPAPRGWFGLRPRSDAVEPQPFFLEFCLLRLRESALENTLEVLRSVHAQTTTFIQDVARSLEKLRHFAEGFTAEPLTPLPATLLETPLEPTRRVGNVPVPNVKELLPDQAKNLPRAAETLFQQARPRLLLDFEAQLQVEVLNPLSGLWSIVSGPRDLDVVLKEVLRKRACGAMLRELEATNAAQLYLAFQENPAHLAADLKAQVALAAPLLSVPPESLHVFAFLPPGVAGAQVNKLLSQGAASDRYTPLLSDGDLIVCQESAPLPVALLAGSLVGSRPGYAEAVQKVLTRMDVHWSTLTPAESRAVA